MASKVLVILAIVLWTMFFVMLEFILLKDNKAFESNDCKHHCEWQLTQMNETFKILITVCEEKLQKLHSSDMNMAIIREQLQKEFLELFLYELQTFTQRLHDSTRIEPAPHFCLEYCTVINTVNYQECKENMTNRHYQIQMLLRRQRWLRSHIRRRLRLSGGSMNSTDLGMETSSMFCNWSHVIAIVVTITLFMVIRPTRSRLAAWKGRKENIVEELPMMRTQLLRMQTQSVVTQQDDTEQLHLVSDKPYLKLSASDVEIILKIIERNSILESWNEELLKSERLLRSRVAELHSENAVLTQDCEEKLAVKDDMLQNTHTEANDLQQFDSRLTDLRLDFESQFTQLQSKFDKQVMEELCTLRKEHNKQCKSLELANGKIIQLERRLACQELILSLNCDNLNEKK